jgi:uncharacterized protein YndB with AHSA1/START domain
MYPQPAPMAVVKRTIRVDVPIEKAFQVFVERMGEWWPASHHIAMEPFKEIVVEKREGGRWFERDSHGAECEWGRVLLWQPPRRLILSWNLQPDFKYSPDQTRASEVALQFSAEGPTATRLEFEHRYLERHGEGFEKLFASVDSAGGWTKILEAFVEKMKE